MDPGASATLVVELRTLEAAAVRKRRWASWKPWAVVGGGVALVVTGVVFRTFATTNLDRFRTGATAICGDVGCTPGTPEYAQFQELEPTESRAKLENGAAISLWVVGGVAVASGLAAVIMNRERLVIPRTETVAITPLISPDLAGLGVAGAF